MSHEIQLILCCASTKISSERTKRIYQLLAEKENINWQFVLATADEHGVIPLVYWQLKEISTQLPTPVWQQLTAAFNQNAYHNLSLTAELCKISKIFTENKLIFLAFKGAVLAKLAYGDIALRQFVDLDILVLESAVAAASNILINHGYQPQFQFTQEQQKQYIKIRSEHNFWHPEKDITVDLHWSVLPKNFSFSPPQELVCSEPQEVSFGSVKIQTLSLETLLLFLSTHAGKHNWNHLCWICDLAELINSHPDLNWHWLEENCHKIGTKKMFWLSLYLAHDLLATSLPQEILERLKADSKTTFLAQEVREILFANKSYSIGSFPVENIYLQTMDSWRDKVWYWLDAIITPTPLEWQIISLPKWLFFIYYPIRLVRIVFRFVLRHEE